MPDSKAKPKAKAAPKGVGGKLNAEYGVGPLKLPLWGWGAVAVGGVWFYFHFIRNASPADTTAGDQTGADATQGASPFARYGGGGGSTNAGGGHGGRGGGRNHHHHHHGTGHHQHQGSHGGRPHKAGGQHKRPHGGLQPRAV